MSQMTIDGAVAPLGRSARSPTRLRLVLLSQYALFGLVIGVQGVLWGDVKSRLGLGDGVFGTAMMLTPLVGFIILVTRGPWRRLGLRASALAGLLAIASALLLLAYAETLAMFVAARLLAGLGFALLDHAVNNTAIGLERSSGRSLIGLLYALFSGGMVAGALAGGGLLAAGLGYREALLLLVPGLLAVIGWTASRSYPELPTVAGGVAPARPGRARPWRGGALIGLALAAVACEAVAEMWGVIYLRALGADALASSVMFALFNGAMIAGRLINGTLLVRWGARPVLLGAGAVLAAAVALLATGGALVSTAAFGLLGLAVAGVVPTLLSVARAQPSVGGDLVVNRIVATSYLGFVVTPPAVGWLAEVLGLHMTLVSVLAGLVVAIAGLSLTAATGSRDSGRTTADQGRRENERGMVEL